jgi:hypothetical protein
MLRWRYQKKPMCTSKVGQEPCLELAIHARQWIGAVALRGSLKAQPFRYDKQIARSVGFFLFQCAASFLLASEHSCAMLEYLQIPIIGKVA